MRMWLFLLLLISVEIVIIWVSLAHAQANSTAAAKGNHDERDDGVERVTRLGSRPPDCEHKCGGCEPCMAIQVPTAAGKLGPPYANYEPEGWKCKCGSAFYNP